jgi:uncharacterized protein YneF (UPF0154 family)
MGLFESAVTGVITGIFLGFGTIIGNYFSNRLVIKHLETIEKRLKIKKVGKK